MTGRRDLESLARRAAAGDEKAALELYLKIVAKKGPGKRGRQSLVADARYADLDADDDEGAPEATVVSFMGQDVRVPAYPQECNYVRVVREGREVAYWNSDEWSESPEQAEDVMGAIMGAIKSVMSGVDMAPKKKRLGPARPSSRIQVLVENDDGGPTASITAFDPAVVGTDVLDGHFTDEGEGHYIALVSDRPDLVQRLEELGFEVDSSDWEPPAP